MFMRHPRVSLILATGGTAMVRAAYSSGTPAIGVGSGNVPALVCADADPGAAAGRGGREQGLRPRHHLRLRGQPGRRGGRGRAVPAALERAGAAVLLAQEERVRVAAHAFDPADGHLRREVLGQPWRAAIAEAAGVRRARPIRVPALPLALDQVDGPSAGRSWPRCCRCSAWTAPTRALCRVQAAAGQPGRRSHRGDPHRRPGRASSASPRRSRPAASWSTARRPTGASASATA